MTASLHPPPAHVWRQPDVTIGRHARAPST
jgi:hypothetical protein